MRKLTHIIRVKKFEPKYEIYVVSGKITKFLQSFNKYEDQLDKFSNARIVLSSVLCVEGNRDLPSDKKIKLNENEFYFSHQILSNTDELYFSPATIDNNQLKQFWLDKKAYFNLVNPLIDKIKNNIECIISERSCFSIKKNENIQLQDGKIINTFKLNKDGVVYTEVSKQQFVTQNKISLNSVIIKNDISNAPKIIPKKYTKFNRLWILIIFIFAFLNCLVLMPKFFPLTEFQIDYILTNYKLKKIENAEPLIEKEKIISKNFNKKIPDDIFRINNLIEAMPQSLLPKLIGLKFITYNEIILKFRNYEMIQINDFLNKNNILSSSTEVNNDVLKLIIKVK